MPALLTKNIHPSGRGCWPGGGSQHLLLVGYINGKATGMPAISADGLRYPLPRPAIVKIEIIWDVAPAPAKSWQ